MFNNGALSFVELEMKAAGIVTYGTDLDNPDFAGIAQAAGLFGARVEKAGDLEDALRAAFSHDGAAYQLREAHFTPKPVQQPRPTIIVGICNVCHPFYTGQQKFVDTAGRVDKFQQRMVKTQAAQAEAATRKKKK